MYDTMQVFLEKNINKLHNLFFDQLRMYFSNTLLSFSYKNVHNVKRNVVVFICVHIVRKGRMDTT